eukprot:452195_1
MAEKNHTQPLLEQEETSALLSSGNHSYRTRDQFDTELSPRPSRLNEEDKSKASSDLLIRSVSPLPWPQDAMNINMTLSTGQKSLSENTESSLTHESGEYPEFEGARGGAQISVINPPYTFQIHNNPFKHYRSDLCLIISSICINMCAIILTLLIFILKEDTSNDSFSQTIDNAPILVHFYPSGYELLRCLFIPISVYIMNRLLHYTIAKSIHYLHTHGERTLIAALQRIEQWNRHCIDVSLILIYAAYIYLICNYWNQLNISNSTTHDDLNIWIDSKYIDRASISWFMLILLMILYVFDICCSVRYGYTYYRYSHYAGNVPKKEQAFDDHYTRQLKPAHVHVPNGSRFKKSGVSIRTVSAVSDISDEDMDSIARLEAARFKRTRKENSNKEAKYNKMEEYKLRHYTLFETTEDNKSENGEEKEFMPFDSSRSSLPKQSKLLRKRKRSRSESDLMRIISPMRSCRLLVGVDGDTNHTSVIMELREKVNFLKAKLLAKQSILDQLKLDLNEQTFIISNLSFKGKQLQKGKQKLENKLMGKNEELEETKLLLQVTEDTQMQIANECQRLQMKLKQLTAASSISVST